jgi:hypothetical protein
LRPDDKPALLERAERGTDRLRRGALDPGQRPGRQRSKTVKPRQDRELEKAGVGGGVRRRVKAIRAFLAEIFDTEVASGTAERRPGTAGPNPTGPST